MVLTDREFTEAGCIFLLIDNTCIPHPVTLQIIEWLEIKNIERFALLDWMLNRWVFLRKNQHHLPKRCF